MEGEDGDGDGDSDGDGDEDEEEVNAMRMLKPFYFRNCSFYKVCCKILVLDLA